MAVTFTLDLRALLAAPAAFALTGPDGVAPGGTQYEPIELLQRGDERHDIVYVCSNGAIARQNLRKLVPKGIRASNRWKTWSV